jgi:hypothetical protein
MVFILRFAVKEVFQITSKLESLIQLEFENLLAETPTSRNPLSNYKIDKAFSTQKQKKIDINQFIYHSDSLPIATNDQEVHQLLKDEIRNVNIIKPEEEPQSFISTSPSQLFETPPLFCLNP